MENADKDNKHKKPAGRPKKKFSERKDRTLSIRLSEPEYFAVKRRASRAGLTISAYSQSAILKAKIFEPVKKEDIEQLKKLSYMGNNINQLTKLAHTFGLNALENKAENVLDEVLKIINQLSDDWKNHKR